METRHVIFSDNFAQILSRVKLDNTNDRISLDDKTDEMVWILFKYIEFRLEIYYERIP